MIDNQPTLYLIPVPLGETEHSRVLPEYNRAVVRHLHHYIVENVRSARRFLKAADRSIDIDSITFYELNKHTSAEEVSTYLRPLETGESMGVISEAGCPAIADPGADVVAIAQRKDLRVEPLVGPSSILMGLMGSGFNGQSFAFKGYLPIDEGERQAALKEMETRIYKNNETQIFIETPYRNEKLVDELIRHCRPTTKLCIASHISCPDELIRTRTLSDWKNRRPALHKIPTIFLLYK